MTAPQIDTLIDAETIAARVAEMGAEISKDYEGKDIVFITVLKGSFVFAADLIRHNSMAACERPGQPMA